MSDIFEDQEERFDNIKKSAEELGGSENTDVQRKQLVPKKNCKICYGRGTVTYGFPGNDGNENVTLVYCRCVREVSV